MSPCGLRGRPTRPQFGPGSDLPLMMMRTAAVLMIIIILILIHRPGGSWWWIDHHDYRYHLPNFHQDGCGPGLMGSTLFRPDIRLVTARVRLRWYHSIDTHSSPDHVCTPFELHELNQLLIQCNVLLFLTPRWYPIICICQIFCAQSVRLWQSDIIIASETLSDSSTWMTRTSSFWRCLWTFDWAF